MIEDRIGQVRLRVRTDVADDARIRDAAERIVRLALERCAALLEERAPGRIVVIRRFPLRWRLDEAAIDDPDHVEELAQATADAIERMAASSPPAELAPPDAGAVLFDDEAHLRAALLLAAARGQAAWFAAALDEADADDSLAALAAPQLRAVARATLVRLARAGVLAEVLAAQPAAAVAVLAVSLGLDRGKTGRVPDAFGRGDAGAPEMAVPAASAELAAIAAAWPALTPAARFLALRAHAAVTLDVDIEARRAIALADAVFSADADAGTPPSGAVEAARAGRAEAVMSPAGPAVERPRGGQPGEQAEAAAIHATNYAGLFYLIDRIQELDLAEALWRVCLPEGMVLAAAASALLGARDADDPAAPLFGGVEVIGCPDIDSEQNAEVAIAACAALAEALPRRGLADIPPVVVHLSDHPAGRLLVAAAEGSPFAFFAWPAATPAILTAGLRALLQSWPDRAAVSAPPGLAGLDPTGRLRPRRETPAVSLLLPAASSAPAAALLALAIGGPATLFAARAGAPDLGTADAFVTRYLARRGRIAIYSDRLEVILAAEDADLALRRVGLDRDPGWVPWLERSVRFVFEE